MKADADEGVSLDRRRRDLLILVAGAMGSIGTAIAVWPLIDSINPSRDTLAAGAPVDVDLSPVQPGQQIVIKWRGRPVFIVRRTPAGLSLLQQPKDINLLRDPKSSALQQPPYAKNWHRSVGPEYLVLVGIRTHLGCIPNLEPKLGQLGANWPASYFGPCHGSKYDLAGRVFAGVPAPYNLPLPPYHFVSKTILRVGENPPRVQFDFASIEQI